MPGINILKLSDLRNEDGDLYFFCCWEGNLLIGLGWT